MTDNVSYECKIIHKRSHYRGVRNNLRKMCTIKKTNFLTVLSLFLHPKLAIVNGTVQYQHSFQALWKSHHVVLLQRKDCASRHPLHSCHDLCYQKNSKKIRCECAFRQLGLGLVALSVFSGMRLQRKMSCENNDFRNKLPIFSASQPSPAFKTTCGSHIFLGKFVDRSSAPMKSTSCA